MSGSPSSMRGRIRASSPRRRGSARMRGRSRRRRPTCADRRVEITGPAERKMMINALNSGARVFMADLEDSHSPTWANVVGGQGNSPMRSAARSASRRREKQLPAQRARSRRCRPAARLASRRAPSAGRRRADLGVAVRLRPVRLPQRARAARARHGAVLLSAEARVAPRGAAVERRLRRAPRTSSGCRAGRSAATVLIETILAAFEMDEILLRAARPRGAG